MRGRRFHKKGAGARYPARPSLPVKSPSNLCFGRNLASRLVVIRGNPRSSRYSGVRRGRLSAFSGSLGSRAFSVALALVIAVAPPIVVAAPASNILPSDTSAAFDRYAQLTQAQFQAQLSPGSQFLWVDGLPAAQRDAAYADLRSGKVVIEREQTLDNGKPIPIPGGMIHHWIATVFIPGATLAQTLSLERDYNDHHIYFQPDVVRSRILRYDGDDFVVELRFKEKKIVTVVLDTQHDIHYQSIDSTHAASWSRTTRVQQVEDAGTPNERLDPPGQDDGFLWRMNTYWKFEQKDGGTYVESQSISLTRNVPLGLGWVVGSFVESIPRESLNFTLSATRAAVLSRMGGNALPAKGSGEN
jgi:hypothetical protein